ncbi:MAG: AMP-binding protein [Holophagae bacterium]|jgi:long-subunit acyl-CoA synthetase (AMP-forming)
MTHTCTVIGVLDDTAGRFPDRTALRLRSADGWRTTNWSDYRTLVRRVGRALMALGVQPGQNTVIIGGNRPEWFAANLGTIAAGGLPSGIYTTSTPEQCAFIVDNCDARVAFIEHPEQLDRLADCRERLTAVVTMDGSGGHGVLTWREFLAAADEIPIDALDRRIEALEPDSPCTLIYTSGTTGEPKGVVLSHFNVLWVADAMVRQFHVTEHDVLVSYLPLSHIAEQLISLYLPLLVGGAVCFAESLETLAETLREVRPTFFFAVPRVWEKIQARMEAAGAASGAVRRRLVRWARGVGLAGARAVQRGGRRPSSWPLADRLVFRAVRRRLGFDRTRAFVTSAAPMARSTLDFFFSLGIPVLEVYGMSECAGPATFSTADRYKIGSAGWAIPGTELRVADDGEILFRGPHVFIGYHRDPESTAATIDDEGWVHSGDIGALDDDGFLWVTDRKKEIIVTSGGKNVAPVPIEAKLKTIPGVAQAVVVGDGRKYLAALIALDPDRICGIAEAVGSDARDVESAARCELIRGSLAEHIDAINVTLARYESIKRFAVISHGLSVDDGTLTPTLKLKRRVIREVFSDVIDELYDEN